MTLKAIYESSFMDDDYMELCCPLTLILGISNGIYDPERGATYSILGDIFL